MKKYPVYYKGKKYEVRWKIDKIVKTIRVYEVLPCKFSKYKDLGTFYLRAIHELHDLDLNDENLHVKEAKHAVQMAIKDIEKDRQREILRETKKQKLQEWDGFIE